MNEVRGSVVDFIRPLKKARGKKQVENPYGPSCTHIITWGYKAESLLGYDGDFAYCFEDQVEGALKVLEGYPEVDGIVVSRVTVEKYISGGVEETV